MRVLYTARGIRDLETVNQARLQEKYGVATGSGYADMAVLRGDPSDGLPGVPGIGEKTAAALVHRYGSLVEILVARDTGDAGLSPTQRRRLTESASYLAVAPAVVRVAPDAPVGEVDDRLPVGRGRRGRARRARGAVGALVERQARGRRPRPRLTPVAAGETLPPAARSTPYRTYQTPRRILLSRRVHQSGDASRRRLPATRPRRGVSTGKARPCLLSTPRP